MDKEVQKGLSDRLYDKRKVAALELEAAIRECLSEKDHEKIRNIIDQLCRDFAYAVHHPNARNGGLIGLAAAAIALGQNEVAAYLEDIIHPVLACFGDQDARVRYYACESMYNIAKVSKGEILLYFNEIFDALAKLATDSEPSVKNGADLLDRLIKDIVSEKATTYVSVIRKNGPALPVLEEEEDPSKPTIVNEPVQDETSFSLPKFIPLLMERIYAINPYARMFLVSWITLLDSIPDLELVSYLPSFLGGLISFLSDPSKDVRVATHAALDGFLQEIRRITDIKKQVSLHSKSNSNLNSHTEAIESTPHDHSVPGVELDQGQVQDQEQASTTTPRSSMQKSRNHSADDRYSESALDFSVNDSVASTKHLQPRPLDTATTSTKSQEPTESGVETDAGTDTTEAKSKQINNASEALENQQPFDKKLPAQPSPLPAQPLYTDETNTTITTTNTNTTDLDSRDATSDTGEIPEDNGLYIPGQDVYINFEKIIEILISHLDSSEQEIQVMVLNWIEILLEMSPHSMLPYGPRFLSVLLPTMAYDGKELRDAAERVNKRMLDLITSLPDTLPPQSQSAQQRAPNDSNANNNISGKDSSGIKSDSQQNNRIDYSATVNALTLHFLNEKEQTRVAALDWLIMLHRKVPHRVLAINDGTFPALLKTLSDPSEHVITKDLQLLAQISYNSNDEYFTAFLVNLLNLFSTDRRLLEVRGNLIIRQLCTSLNPERIYRTMAEILERGDDDDLEFASTMVQNLNNNLITAPELADLRMRLRSIDNNRDGAGFFVSLFKSWCHNSAAALSLCLLAQAYEHAFAVLQIIVEFEITVPLLVQMDKLVQLLESPVFTHLRLQLLEPEKYPYLYKCLYGILMVLPQSPAFNTLRNRLNSVSPIGFIPGGASPVSAAAASTTTTVATGAASANTRRGGSVASSSGTTGTSTSREDVKWGELLDKFRIMQKKQQEARNQEFSRSISDLKLHMMNDESSNGNRTKGREGSSGGYGAIGRRNIPTGAPGAATGGASLSSSTTSVGNPKGSDQRTPSKSGKRSRGPFGLRRFGDDKKR